MEFNIANQHELFISRELFSRNWILPYKNTCKNKFLCYKEQKFTKEIWKLYFFWIYFRESSKTIFVATI